MYNEIVTDPLEPEDLWYDLKANINLLKELEIPEVLLFFGFSWGQHVYEDKWVDRPTPTAQIEEQIRQVETKDFGQIGHDNLYLTVPAFQVKIVYSHESDISLSYGQENPFVTAIINRWSEQRWLLVHWSKQKRLAAKKT